MAPSRKLKIVISDFHIGDGKRHADGRHNIGEDFYHDDQFCALLQYYMDLYPKGGDVELIINGDFLNFMFVFYRGRHPLHVTQEISLEKLKGMVRAHSTLFSQLSKFAQQPGFRVAYILGNHDIDMIWPACQDYFKSCVGAEVRFYPVAYEFDGVHIEHGNRFELFNSMDMNHPILHEGEASFLNLPFGSFFATLFVAPLKITKPHIDKIKPFRVFLMLDLLMHFSSAVKVWIKFFTFFVGFLLSPYRHRFPAVRNTMQIILAGMSMYPNIDKSARALLRAYPHLHTVLFGHTHVSKYIEFHDKKVYINSGTWNEITTLDLSQFGKRELKTFVEIRYSDDEKTPPKSKLKVWHGDWEPFHTVY